MGSEPILCETPSPPSGNTVTSAPCPMRVIEEKNYFWDQEHIKPNFVEGTHKISRGEVLSPPWRAKDFRTLSVVEKVVSSFLPATLFEASVKNFDEVRT